MKNKKAQSFILGSINKTQNITSKLHDTSLSAQRQRLLAYLRTKPINTIQARQCLNVLSPAPRVFELRKRGCRIITIMVDEFDAQGNKHHIAEYSLLKGNGGKDE
jgi:hypothetical protein